MAASAKKRGFTVAALKTPVFHIGESLIDFIDAQVSPEDRQEGLVLAVTSKIVSLAENRLVAKASIDKSELVQRECEHFLGKISYDCHLTVQHGILLPAAGIDESNSENDAYILLPQDPYASAETLYGELGERWQLKNFGLLITDSHTSPLRRGVTGVALAHWGFKAVIDKRQQPDLFGRPLKMTTINTADALAAAAVWCMGEADDSCPLAVIHGAELDWSTKTSPEEVRIPLEEDLYAPLLRPLLSYPRWRSR